MGIFLERVRKSEIPHPTQKKFKIDDWEQAFESSDAHESVDVDLYEAGKFFDSVLSGLRDQLTGSKFRQICRHDRIVAICALINHEMQALGRKLNAERHNRKKGETLFLLDEIARKVTLPSGIQVTPDQLLTSLLDCIVYPLDEALQDDEDGKPFDATFESDLYKAFIIANAYHTASDLWHDCLWNDRVIEVKSKNRIEIGPRNIEHARQSAVSEHRYDMFVTQLAQHAGMFWRNHLTPTQKKALVIDRGVIAVKKKSRGNPYVIKRLNLHRRRNQPPGVAEWFIANEGYLQPFVSLPLPSCSRLSVGLLYKAWRVLDSLVRVSLSEVPDTPHDINFFLSHAIRVNRNHLTTMFMNALDVDEDTGMALSKFFTYKPRTDGLWQKPLIPLNNTEYLVAAVPFSHGNMLRIAERWLRQGGFGLNDRGPVFERFARDEIAKFLNASERIRNAIVASKPIYVGEGHEEIDLLIRIGSLVLVGEAKCQLLPTDPIEIFRFRNRLREAADQASRKAAIVRSQIDDVQEVLHLSAGQSVNVVPFVLSNTIRESGFPIDGVAVTDLLYLGTLFRDGGLRTMAVVDRDGVKEVGHFIQYYNDENDAAQRIPNLLLRQPVVDILNSLVQTRTRPMPIATDNREIAERYFAVSIEMSDVDFNPKT